MAYHSSFGIRVVALILVILLGAYAVLAVLPSRDSFRGKNPLMKEGDMPMIIAHRGGRNVRLHFNGRRLFLHVRRGKQRCFHAPEKLLRKSPFLRRAIHESRIFNGRRIHATAARLLQNGAVNVCRLHPRESIPVCHF